MSDYVKTTDFDAKDTNNDTVLGADFTLEYDAVASASATKVNKVGSPVTGNLMSQTSTGDAQDSALKTAKTPQVDATVTFEKEVVFDAVVDNGTGGSKTIDWTTGNKQKYTLSSNGTLTFTAPSGPCNMVLKITNSGAARTITWPAAVAWSGGGVPSPSASTQIDIYTFFYDGTTYYGGASLDY